MYKIYNIEMTGQNHNCYLSRYLGKKTSQEITFMGTEAMERAETVLLCSQKLNLNIAMLNICQHRLVSVAIGM